MTVSPDGSIILVANTGTVAAPGDSITIIDVVSNEMQSIPTGTMPVGIAVIQEVGDAGQFICKIK
jgi:YVTN family beta-propeller protein